MENNTCNKLKDKELIEMFNEIDSYFIEVQKEILAEIERRNLIERVSYEKLFLIKQRIMIAINNELQIHKNIYDYDFETQASKEEEFVIDAKDKLVNNKLDDEGANDEFSLQEYLRLNKKSVVSNTKELRNDNYSFDATIDRFRINLTYVSRKSLKSIIINIGSMLFICLAIILYPGVEKRKSRVYQSPNIGKIDKKYPDIYIKRERYRQMILSSITSQTISIKGKDKDIREMNYYDKAGRLVYKIVENTDFYVSIGHRRKDTLYYTPDEEGYIYDENGVVIKKVEVIGGRFYKVRELGEESRENFLKTGSGAVNCIDIINVSDSKKKEVKEYIDEKLGFQYYRKIERIYENGLLYKEIEFQDQELDNSFIMATIEKKYNDKGEIIYKTVERKDKTNDYKSITEMDFTKDEIVTKYYKGKKVFATVTENLIGAEEVIEEIKMVRGEEIKKSYRNKLNVVVQRQNIDDSNKIVDIQSYDKDERKMNVERYIFDREGVLRFRFKGIKGYKRNYLYDEGFSDTIESSYLYDSFYTPRGELDEYYEGIYEVKNIQRFVVDSKEVKISEQKHGNYLRRRNIDFRNSDKKDIEIKNIEVVKMSKVIKVEDLINEKMNEH